MSKKIIFSFLIAGLILTAVAPAVLADDEPQPAAPKTLKERLQEKRVQIETKIKERQSDVKAKVEDKKAKVEEKREALKRKLESARADRVKKYVKRMADRFEAAVKRLDVLAQRIDARLVKIAAGGKNTDDYKKLLGEARTKIESAKTKLSEVRLALEAVADSEKPKEDFENAKAKLNEVKEAVKTAHAALVSVISSIKGASEKK
ncbi:MAG: hypothetical protein HYV54_02015 [Parcubacteria group bacterium]|nr:hypothetical protein [Parcubacteria group bacterium]